MVLGFEILKALLKFKEYRALVTKEHIKTYVDFDSYKNLKQTEAYEASLCKLARSDKVIKRPENPVKSQGYLEL